MPKASYSSLWMLSGWLLLLAFPSFSMVVFHQSSFSAGLILLLPVFIACCLAIVGFRKGAGKFLINQQIVLIAGAFCLFFLVHVNLVQMLNRVDDFDFFRYAMTSVVLLLYLLVSYIIAVYLKNYPNRAFHFVVISLIVVLLLMSVFGLFGIDLFNLGHTKTVFIYQEPSHFALIFIPFLIYAFIRFSRCKTLLLFTWVLIWIFVVNNLILTVGFLLALLLSVRLNIPFLVLLLAGVLLMSFTFFDMSYFVDRLDFSSENSNLSVLVFIQGWENAFLTFFDSHFIGSGFQQFGILTSEGETTSRIIKIMGFPINKYDGGTLGSKIIGEFGLFGVAFLLVYLRQLLISFLALRKNLWAKQRIEDKTLFAHVVIVSFSIEMFLRGVGYFSPSLIMYLVASFYLVNLNAQRKRARKRELLCI